MTVYYAHCMNIYDTPQELRDLETLERLGFTVLNPNNEKTQKEWGVFSDSYDYEEAFRMVFGDAVRRCDVFAFRALPDGSIPKGVHAELGYAVAYQKPIIELPYRLTGRGLSIAETRERLQLLGQR